jgi:hypothetical protein
MTDIPFCILFILFWIGSMVVMAKALEKGEPTRLLYGVDYIGNICSVNNGGRGNFTRDLTNMPVLYWPNPTDLKYHICVPKCPTKADVPEAGDYFGLTDSAKSKFQCNYNVVEEAGTQPYHTYTALDLGTTCFPKYETTEVLNRCVPGTFNATLNAQGTSGAHLVLP